MPDEPRFTKSEVESIVTGRLERLRSTWAREHEDLLATIDALHDEREALQAELAEHRNRDLGAATPLRHDDS